eukprot:NODE_3144_length_449_cov_37.406832_g3094_i0.p1 GENE.NODE_3144_length_449_cov_37.406832_g3094_i0~~NODE_3144_length_449_cov_37.406832_g3094_i0.p1  ORF type:complete len:111 (-),score=16.19 NODE_3144_length_449_cov_37.406832_g3094_i0:35-367(-)
MSNTFSTGLFGCFSDMGICVWGWCCPICLVTDNSAGLDGNQNCCMCCYPGNSFKNRMQAHAKFHYVPESWCTACMTSCLCGPCSERQIARELKIKSASTAYEAPAEMVRG